MFDRPVEITKQRKVKESRMRKMLNYLSLIALAVILVVPLAGCQQAEEEGPVEEMMEDAGEAMDDAVDSAEDAMEDAGDAAEEMMDEGEDAAEEMGEEMEEAAEEVEEGMGGDGS